MQSWFTFTPTAEIDIRFDGEEQREWVDVQLTKEKREQFPLYHDGESVAGTVTLRVRNGRKLEHQGVRIQLIGQIEIYPEKAPHPFISLGQELLAPGEIDQLQTLSFEFKNVEKQYESFAGQSVRLRYFVRITVSRRLSECVREKELWVYTYSTSPDSGGVPSSSSSSSTTTTTTLTPHPNPSMTVGPPPITSSTPIKMEVGIEECLHIEFEYNQAKYSLTDVIVGKIRFLLVRIPIKYMELSILRREITGLSGSSYPSSSSSSSSSSSPTDSTSLVKFEIMDGSPVKGAVIPLRLFLSGYELTPTLKDVNKRFSVRYFLNLVLVDDAQRRYFKQQEIALFRERPSPLKTPASSLVVANVF